MPELAVPQTRANVNEACHKPPTAPRPCPKGGKISSRKIPGFDWKSEDLTKTQPTTNLIARSTEP